MHIWPTTLFGFSAIVIQIALVPRAAGMFEKNKKEPDKKNEQPGKTKEEKKKIFRETLLPYTHVMSSIKHMADQVKGAKTIIELDRIGKNLVEAQEKAKLEGQVAEELNAELPSEDGRKSHEIRRSLLDEWGGDDFKADWWWKVTAEDPVTHEAVNKTLYGDIRGVYMNSHGKCRGHFRTTVSLELKRDFEATPKGPQLSPEEEEAKKKLEKLKKVEQLQENYKQWGMDESLPEQEKVDATVARLNDKYKTDWTKKQEEAVEEEIKKLGGKWVFANSAYGFMFDKLMYTDGIGTAFSDKVKGMDGTKKCVTMQADMQEILFESAEDHGFHIDAKRNGYLKSEIKAFVKVSVNHCQDQVDLIGKEKDGGSLTMREFKEMKEYACTGFKIGKKFVKLFGGQTAVENRLNHYDRSSKYLERFVNCVNLKMIRKIGDGCANAYARYNVGRKLEMELCERSGTTMIVRGILKAALEIPVYVGTFAESLWDYREVEHLSFTERLYWAAGATALSLASYSVLAYTFAMFKIDHRIIAIFGDDELMYPAAAANIMIFWRAVERYTIIRCSDYDPRKDFEFLAKQIEQYRNAPVTADYLAQPQYNHLRLGGDALWRTYFVVVKDRTKEDVDKANKKLNWFDRKFNKVLSSDENYDRYDQNEADLFGVEPMPGDVEDKEENARLIGYFAGWYNEGKGNALNDHCEGFFSGTFDVPLKRPEKENSNPLSEKELAAEKKEEEEDAKHAELLKKEAEKQKKAGAVALLDLAEPMVVDKVQNPGGVAAHRINKPKRTWIFKYQGQGFDQKLVFDMTKGTGEELKAKAKETKLSWAYDKLKKRVTVKFQDESGEKGPETDIIEVENIKPEDAKPAEPVEMKKKEEKEKNGKKTDEKPKFKRAKKTSAQKLVKETSCKNLVADVVTQLMQDKPEHVNTHVTGYTPRQVRAFVRTSVQHCFDLPKFKDTKVLAAHIICLRVPEDQENYIDPEGKGAKLLEEYMRAAVQIIGCAGQEAAKRLANEKCEKLLEGSAVVAQLQKTMCRQKGIFGWGPFNRTWRHKAVGSLKNRFKNMQSVFMEQHAVWKDKDVKIKPWLRMAFKVFAFQVSLVEMAVPVLAIGIIFWEISSFLPVLLANIGSQLLQYAWMKRMEAIAVMNCDEERFEHAFNGQMVNDQTADFMKKKIEAELHQALSPLKEMETQLKETDPSKKSGPKSGSQDSVGDVGSFLLKKEKKGPTLGAFGSTAH